MRNQIHWAYCVEAMPPVIYFRMTASALKDWDIPEAVPPVDYSRIVASTLTYRNGPEVLGKDPA